MIENRDDFPLRRILEAIEAVADHLKGVSEKDFVFGSTIYDAVLMRMVQIGEIANKEISEEFKDKYPHLPWHQAVGLRNHIAHGYYEIKPKLIWKIAKEDLPELKKEIEKII